MAAEMVVEEDCTGRQQWGKREEQEGKANVQRMHSLLNSVMRERDVIFFTWRNQFLLVTQPNQD